MKIYTKTGDDGETGLYAGPRVRKDDSRIEAYGTVDELNAALGLVRASDLPADTDALLAAVQADLFTVGAQLAAPDGCGARLPKLGPDEITALEAAIDEHEARLTPLRHFILPGGSASSAALHLARAICRRAERRVVSLQSTGCATDADRVLVYLNRLGDLLFVLARGVNAVAGVADVPWSGSAATDESGGTGC
jgi:cob(I)alamin adenosyltransferase